MGIIKDLKNLFFGASAITKSATGKAADYVKEEGDIFLDKGKDLLEKSGGTILEKTSGLKDSILENSSDILEKTKEGLTNLGEEIKSNPMTEKLADATENIGEKVLNKGEILMDKAGEISTTVGGVVMEKGEVLLDKSKDLSEDVGSKVLDAKDKIMDKAGEVKDQLADKLDKTMDDADAWAAHEKANPKPEFAEDTIDASGSLLEGKDDFFSKADKYASGDYGAFSEGKISLEEDPSKLPKQKFEELPPATGFEDRDGDGNELIDDAIIDED